jgi:exodeoxyribonuclease III
VWEGTIKIASWNVNSVRARMEHLKGWLTANRPDVMLLQELKAPAFPAEIFTELGYESAAVTQKAYNGVAVLSLRPIETVSVALDGNAADTHARFLEVKIEGIRFANIYLPNGNPIGSEKFEYKLAWMDRLIEQLKIWLDDGVPTVIGGDYNVIPEDIDCHKPTSWMRDALFQPEPRERYRAMLKMGYTDAFRSLHPELKEFTFWDYFRKAFDNNRGIRIDHFLLSPDVAKRMKNCVIDKGPRRLEKPSDHTPIILEIQ